MTYSIQNYQDDLRDTFYPLSQDIRNESREVTDDLHSSVPILKIGVLAMGTGSVFSFSAILITNNAALLLAVLRFP